MAHYVHMVYIPELHDTSCIFSVQRKNTQILRIHTPFNRNKSFYGDMFRRETSRGAACSLAEQSLSTVYFYKLYLNNTFKYTNN